MNERKRESRQCTAGLPPLCKFVELHTCAYFCVYSCRSITQRLRRSQASCGAGHGHGRRCRRPVSAPPGHLHSRAAMCAAVGCPRITGVQTRRAGQIQNPDIVLNSAASCSGAGGGGSAVDPAGAPGAGLQIVPLIKTTWLSVAWRRCGASERCRWHNTRRMRMCTAPWPWRHVSISDVDQRQSMT